MKKGAVFLSITLLMLLISGCNKNGLSEQGKVSSLWNNSSTYPVLQEKSSVFEKTAI